MNRLPLLIIAVVACLAWACSDDDTWNDYADWREANEQWIAQQAQRKNPDGSDFYTRLTPDWDKNAYILIHYFNDRSLTQGRLSPLFTSTCDVIYRGELYNSTPFDSSYTKTADGDSIFRCRPSGVIQGWAIALMDMRPGDTCEVVIPYAQGYGVGGSGVIKPFSALKFGMKLVDIPDYEIR